MYKYLYDMVLKGLTLRQTPNFLESVLLLANLKVKLGALAIFAITCIKTPPAAKNKP